MKHTIYSHAKIDGDDLILRTEGVEGTTVIPLTSLRKVKFPFPSVTIETDTRTYRLDLRNFDPSEIKKTQLILTEALKKRKGRSQPPLSPVVQQEKSSADRE